MANALTSLLMFMVVFLASFGGGCPPSSPAPAAKGVVIQPHCLILGDTITMWLTVENDSEKDIALSQFALFGFCRSSSYLITSTGRYELLKTSPTQLFDPGGRATDLVRIGRQSAISLVIGTEAQLSDTAVKTIKAGTAPVVRLEGSLTFEVDGKDHSTKVHWEGKVFVPPSS